MSLIIATASLVDFHETKLSRLIVDFVGQGKTIWIATMYIAGLANYCGLRSALFMKSTSDQLLESQIHYQCTQTITQSAKCWSVSVSAQVTGDTKIKTSCEQPDLKVVVCQSTNHDNNYT